MLKKNMPKVIISSVITLLPMLFGIIMWNKLPDTMTTHWGADGVADGFSGKAFAVFGLPCILLATHIFCLLFTLLDKKQKEQTPKALDIVYWIVPSISLFANAIMYRAVFDMDINLTICVPLLFGAMFIFIGNYLPKVKQNKTIGIKVWWALSNEENWNKTHRFGGKLWVAGGILLLCSAFLPLKAMGWVLLSVLAVTVIVPVVYSYCIYRQHRKQGIDYAAPSKSKTDRIAGVITAVVVPIILVGVAVMMFTGNIDVKCSDSSFRIDTTYWEDIEVDYSDIDSVDYRKDLDVGSRTYGFGSARLSLGIFRNEEFGSYTLYAYKGAKEYVVIASDDKTLVIGLRDAKDTQAVYDTISSNVSE